LRDRLGLLEPMFFNDEAVLREEIDQGSIKYRGYATLNE